MSPTIPLEKRRHKRYPLPDDTVAISDAGIGSVLDISEGGFAIKYLKPKDLPDEGEALVFCAERDFLVSDLPIQVVRKEEAEISQDSETITQTVGVKLNNPDPGQQAQIKQLVAELSKS